jgi:putative spermidine/putrescine transport system substrate-binding protein
MNDARRKFLLESGAAAAALGLAGLPRFAAAQAATELTVTVYGGSFEEGWKKAVFEPFEKANPNFRIKVGQGLTFQNVALMRAQKDDVKVDVIMMDEVAASEAAAEGLTDPLSVQAVPNLADLYPEFRKPGDPYAKFMYVSEVIAYNKDKIKEAPKSYADFWDPKYKGKIAINNLDTTTGLMFFLLINKMRGGSIENPEPGFKAMKELRSSIVTFPTQHAQLSQLFTQGDIVMAPWVSDRATGLGATGAPVAWTIPAEGGILAEGCLAIAKGTKNRQAALNYINLAIGTKAQSDNARFTYLSPVNSKATLDPAIAKANPNGLEALKHISRPDWAQVNAVRAQWIDRWNREIVS